jgi:Raf kinase inhibitor-like YbhB/YbcL family protein
MFKMAGRWERVVTGAVALAMLGGVGQWAGSVVAAQDAKAGGAKFELTSSSFEADGTIPTKYSCEGDNISPELSWKNAPKETQSLVLIVDDPDNPKKTIVHWVVYDIPATAHELRESTPDKPVLPDGSKQGKNEDGKTRWRGPCPPQGAAHHYFFKLYALDQPTGLKPKATRAQIDAAIKGHILAEAELIGRFEKAPQP